MEGGGEGLGCSGGVDDWLVADRVKTKDRYDGGGGGGGL